MFGIDQIQHAFSPAQEILDPTLFVGRKDEIKNGMLALNNTGSFLAIYGLRGVGKSSIAHQIRIIAKGDDKLPNTLDLKKYIPRHGFNYITHYIKCDNSIQNVFDLIKRILFGDDENPSLFSLTYSGDRRLDSFKRTVEAGAGANIFGNKIEAKGQEETGYKTYVSDDLIQQFKQILGTIQKDNQGKTGILIIIDEFDTLSDKTGFSSLIKTCSSQFVKFGIVGIAHSITELIVDHSSIARQIESVEVNRMPENEMYEILKKAEYKVNKEIIFDDESKKTIVKLSEGFPYFVHLLGRESMLIAFERNKRIIDKTIVDELGDKITQGRLKTIYESIYHNAVKSSAQREILLKLFSESDKDEIFSEEIYRIARGLEISNPSQLMKELTAPESGAPILIKLREQYYRFTDPVFKVYARIRNWKYK